MTEQLKILLENLHDKYNTVDFIELDPVSIPHRFTTREDREISGFLAATIAWGNRKMIVRNASRLMELMDDAPYDFVMNANEKELNELKTFVHRTFNGEDCVTFIHGLRQIYSDHGGIGVYFTEDYARNNDLRIAISNFRKTFFNIEHEHRAMKHLSSIDKGAACKRLNMYLRWMVRRDDRGVDFGLWEGIPMSALYLPLDVHSGNVSRQLGMLTRKQDDWKAVEEVMAELRAADPNDPVKYDYALFGAGVMKGV